VINKSTSARWIRKRQFYHHLSVIFLSLKNKFIQAVAQIGLKNILLPVARKQYYNCSTADEIYKQLERTEEVIIQLTGKEYKINKPFIISKTVQFKSDKKNSIKFETENILSRFYSFRKRKSFFKQYQY
jgi:hypothetical protein